MIRPANLDDIPQILSLTRACAANLEASGIYQWNESYPNKEVFLNDLEREELYLLTEQDTILGCIAPTLLKDEEYEDVEWIVPEGKHLYIHRLAVHPAYQGKGLAGRLMDFAETMGRESHFDSIRLDTFSENPRSNALYRGRGYIHCGDIQLPQQSNLPFHCYELAL